MNEKHLKLLQSLLSKSKLELLTMLKHRKEINLTDLQCRIINLTLQHKLEEDLTKEKKL